MKRLFKIAALVLAMIITVGCVPISENEPLGHAYPIYNKNIFDMAEDYQKMKFVFFYVI